MSKTKEFKSKQNSNQIEEEIINKSQKAILYRRRYNKIRTFRNWARKNRVIIIEGKELQKVWLIHKLKAYTPENRLLLKLIAYRTRKQPTVSMELSHVLNKEKLRFLHILKQIYKEYKKQSRREFLDYIPSSNQNTDSDPVQF